MKGSIIIVDRSVDVVSGMLVVCCVDEEWLTRKLIINGENSYLCINDTLEGCINVTGKVVSIFGSVTWTCLPHSFDHVRTGRL